MDVKRNRKWFVLNFKIKLKNFNKEEMGFMIKVKYKLGANPILTSS